MDVQGLDADVERRDGAQQQQPAAAQLGAGVPCGQPDQHHVRPALPSHRWPPRFVLSMRSARAVIVVRRPSRTDLDKLTANVRANSGRVRFASIPAPPTVLFRPDADTVVHAPHAARPLQLSFYIKRYCNTTALAYTNAGLDDNAFQTSNLKYVAVLAALPTASGFQALTGERCDAGTTQADGGVVRDVRRQRNLLRGVVHVQHQLLRHRLHVRP